MRGADAITSAAYTQYASPGQTGAVLQRIEHCVQRGPVRAEVFKNFVVDGEKQQNIVQNL